MIDHLDTKTNDFLENGTRGNVITAIPDCVRDFISDRGLVYIGPGANRIPEPSSSRPVINIDSWGKSTPVDSIFAESPLPEPEPIVRPATVPKKVRNKLVEIKPNQFISYQAIADFCDKVGEL